VREQYLQNNYGIRVGNVFRLQYYSELLNMMLDFTGGKFVLIFLRRKVPGQTGARIRDLRKHRLALYQRSNPLSHNFSSLNCLQAALGVL
jgi:hypothetical protein